MRRQRGPHTAPVPRAEQTRPRTKLGSSSDGMHAVFGGYRLDRLPAADEQANGIDPRDEE